MLVLQRFWDPSIEVEVPTKPLARCLSATQSKINHPPNTKHTQTQKATLKDTVPIWRSGIEQIRSGCLVFLLLFFFSSVSSFFGDSSMTISTYFPQWPPGWHHHIEPNEQSYSQPVAPKKQRILPKNSILGSLLRVFGESGHLPSNQQKGDTTHPSVKEEQQKARKRLGWVSTHPQPVE